MFLEHQEKEFLKDKNFIKKKNFSKEKQAILSLWRFLQETRES